MSLGSIFCIQSRLDQKLEPWHRLNLKLELLFKAAVPSLKPPEYTGEKKKKEKTYQMGKKIQYFLGKAL